MVDPGRVRRLLEQLTEYRDRLASLRELPRETYLEQHAFEARYLVQASAQACVDIANHLIASSGWRAPRELRDAFTVLEENDVLESDLAERLRELVGLRNRLVHVYGEVDDAIVHESLREGLTDFDEFARVICRRTEAEQGAEQGDD